MIKIDTANPIPTPFRPNAATNPIVEYEYATRIFEAADGTEQRQSVRSRPLMRIRYSTLTMSVEHASKYFEIMERETPTAVAIPDFVHVGQGPVQPGSWNMRIPDTFCSWPPGLMVQVYSVESNTGAVMRILAFDPISKTITFTGPLPMTFRAGEICDIASVVSASIGEVSAVFHGPETLKFDVEASIYPQEVASFPVAQDPAFIFAHQGVTPPEAAISRPLNRIDHGSGPIFDFVGVNKGMGGVRTYTFSTRQVDQTSKEALIRFFKGCRGRAMSFVMPDGVVPGGYGSTGKRFRLASDILSVEHIDADKTECTIRVVEVRK